MLVITLFCSWWFLSQDPQDFRRLLLLLNSQNFVEFFSNEPGVEVLATPLDRSDRIDETPQRKRKRYVSPVYAQSVIVN